MHELHGDAALEDRDERAIDGRHPAGPELGVQPLAAVELHADEGAHPILRPIVDYLAGVAARFRHARRVDLRAAGEEVRAPT
jgi:hypothetical protein